MKQFFKFIIIFLIISGWIFSGWPQIWQNPRIPPEIQKARAAVAFDAVTESHTGTTGSTNQASFTFSHNPVGTPRGILVFVLTISATKKVTGVTYDGEAMTEVTGGAAVDTATEPGRVDTFFLGTGVNITDPANVVVSRTNDATVMYAASMSVTAGADTEVTGIVLLQENQAYAEQSVDDGSPGTDSVRFAMGYLGANSPPAAGANSTLLVGIDLGSFGANVVRETTAGQGVRLVGFTSGADDAAGVHLAVREIPPSTTFLGNDTDPGVNPTIAPGAATTTVGTFNLKTSSGTDTVTNATTTLSAGSFTGLFGVEITNSGNTTIYCSSYNPSDVVVGLTGCSLPVTSASTTFNIRVKPKTHAAMDVPPGATYTVSATTTALTATNSTSGADTSSDAVTIDNASPNGATATSGSAGNAKVTLNWTTSNSSDFDTTSGSVILRWTAGAAGPSVPAEGKSDYTAGDTIATSTVACVISSAGSTAQTKIDGSGGDVGCTTTALTNGQQYTYKAFQRDTNGNYDVGVNIGTFTPQAVSFTFTIDTNNVSFVSAITPGTPVSTSSVLTVNTNSSTGYNITINRASTTPTLILSADNSTTIGDIPNGNNWTAPAATSTAGPSAVWTSGTTKSLGFRVKQTGTVSNTYSSVWWGTSDAGANALYSGISTSTAAQKIANTTLGSGSNENTTVEYRIDVNNNQKSGAYISSPVIYTAVVNL